jgi:hypothetical protein
MDPLMPTLQDLYKQGRMTWPTEGAWDGVNPHARSVASVTWTVRLAPEPPMVFIEIDGESITQPAPTPVER